MFDVSELPAVWDGQSPSVCRDIQLEIVRRHTEYGNRGRPDYPAGTIIEPCSLPTRRVGMTEFVGFAASNQAIEYLGRPDSVDLLDFGDDGYVDILNFSSRIFDVVLKCFAKHYPLGLRPEVLMHLIATEVATCIKLHPEEFRHLLTDSDQRQLIEVRHDGLVLGQPSPWHEALGMFAPELGVRIPSELGEVMTARFSTDTVESMVSRLVTLMDASSPFYSFAVASLCGIPRIRLLGEPADYEQLVISADTLRKLMGRRLERYFRHLIPLLEKIAYQAGGDVQDDAFWSSIFKDNSYSGSDTNYFSGWLSAFTNYLREPDGGRIYEKSGELYDWQKLGKTRGLQMSRIPSHISRVPFLWKYGIPPVGVEMPMELLGGALGVDNVAGFATPALSFAVVHAQDEK